MNIEVKRIVCFEGSGTLVACADVLVDEWLLIIGVRVMRNTQAELFVAMPHSQGKDGIWYDMIVPVKKEAHKMLADKVLEAYAFENVPTEDYSEVAL